MSVESTDDWNLHWERYAPSAEINPAQKYRRDLVLQALSKCQQDRFLDIGSGQGDLCSIVQSVFPKSEIRGLELSEVGVREAQKKVPRGMFLQRDLTEVVPVPAAWSAWATVAVCSEVLEHVDDPGSFLQAVAPFLAASAKLVVTVPAGPMSAFDRHIGHRRHFTPDSLSHVAAEGGFKVKSICSAGFPFMNLYKLIVILRGKRLIEDVAQEQGASASWLARVLMRIFSTLFHFNLSQSPWGWQLVAVLEKN